MLLRIDAIIRMQAHRDIARFAHGIHPVADFHAGEGDAQRLRGIAHRDPELVCQPAIELDSQLVLRILLRETYIDRARNCRTLSMKSLVISMRRRESSP